MGKRFGNVWDAIYDTPDEAENLKWCSGFLILIQARLNGQPGNEADKAK